MHAYGVGYYKVYMKADMIAIFKKHFYFPLASYFRFFARIRLQRWQPRIVVVTGSNGKTTLLHMLEAQIGDKAKYSHHANSSFGIPFDLLDLHRKTLKKEEWISLLFLAPFHALKNPPKEKIYIVEADCDRPGEGKFLAEFLRHEVVLWVSTSRTHGMNFEQLILNKQFSTIEESIAYEFGFFLEYCSRLAVINGDAALQVEQQKRTKAEVKKVTKKNLEKYEVTKEGTTFVIAGDHYHFSYLLPKAVFGSIVMCKEAVAYLGLPFDAKFSHFSLPPGRSSIFQGIKNTTIIDSSYNANLSSMTEILEMFAQLPGDKKWAVIGDMLEQGEGEEEEHEKLAALLLTYNFDRILFMGPRVSKYTYPKLQNKTKVETFLGPKELLDYLTKNISGGETILFKGARFMEGVIEHLLQDKKDVAKLARREEMWEIRRKKWGL